jgi:hypothetical protein
MSTQLNQIKELSESILLSINTLFEDHLAVDAETYDAMCTSLGIIGETIEVLTSQVEDLEGAIISVEDLGCEISEYGVMVHEADLNTTFRQIDSFMTKEIKPE